MKLLLLLRPAVSLAAFAAAAAAAAAAADVAVAAAEGAVVRTAPPFAVELAVYVTQAQLEGQRALPRTQEESLWLRRRAMGQAVSLGHGPAFLAILKMKGCEPVTAPHAGGPTSALGPTVRQRQMKRFAA